MSFEYRGGPDTKENELYRIKREIGLTQWEIEETEEENQTLRSTIDDNIKFIEEQRKELHILLIQKREIEEREERERRMKRGASKQPDAATVLRMKAMMEIKDRERQSREMMRISASTVSDAHRKRREQLEEDSD